MSAGVAYRRLASPAHAARAVAAGGYCVALAGVALATVHPLILGALAVAVAGAAVLARVGREVARSMRLAVPLAVLFALLNPFVSRNGLTVLARLGDVPPFGQVDLTLEALVYGLVFGLRLIVVIGAFALFSAVVAPEELLALFRRISPRSALTAVLATRMLPVLVRDAQRIEDARRCRADGGGHGPAARVAALRAVTGGALDRALDVAATLEVRGYGGAAAPARGGIPWSRHDRAFALSGVLIAVLAVGGRLAGLASFGAYPELHGDLGGAEGALAALLILVALAPFADRRGVR